MSFDGIDDAVEISTDSMEPNGGSVCLWVWAEGFSATHYYLFGHTIGSWSNRIQLYIDDLEGGLDLGLGDLHYRHTNIDIVEFNKWYHIALTWNGIEYAVYVNGTRQINGSYAGLSTLDSYADIGNTGYRTDRHEAFSGIIDEVRIYTRALTTDKVLAVFSSAGRKIY